MPALEDVRAALQAQYAVLVHGFASLDPAGPTDCEGWTVADLETHVTITARGLARASANPVTAPTTGGIAAWTEATPALAEVADAGAKAERLQLKDFAAAAVAALDDDSKVIEQVTGGHGLVDAGVFRVVEGVVHGLDAGIAPDRGALKLVVKQLASAFATRHPGKAVELRVPPYTAVQCVEGPRHTRGTPPNVVECDPVAFVRVMTGRESWADVTRDGRVRASGERADLSPLLPLLS